MTATITNLHQHDSEAVVLGCVLLDAPECWPSVADLTPQHFYREAYRGVFRAMAAIVDKEGAAGLDLVTLGTYLRDTKALDRVGGIGVVSSLPMSVPSITVLDHHVHKLRQAYVARQAVQMGVELAATPPGADLEGVLAQKRAQIDSLVADLDPRSGTPISDALTTVFAQITDAVENGSAPGLPTGYRDLDARTFGLDPTDLAILAARPAMGKSALALGIALKVAERGGGVLFFSLEMSAEQMALRAVSSWGRVTTQDLKSGKVKGDDFSRVVEAFKRLNRLPIVFHDDPGMTPARVLAETKAWARDAPLRLVVVDYLQKMRAPSTLKGRSREQEVAYIAGELKCLSMGLKVPVLALAQLNRGVEARSDKRPLLGDLRESGAIEQDADQVWMLYRGDYYEDPDSDPGVAEVLIRKARSGVMGGEVKLKWTGKFTRFDDLSTVQMYGGL